jgi:hypothetical protein
VVDILTHDAALADIMGQNVCIILDEVRSSSARFDFPSDVDGPTGYSCDSVTLVGWCREMLVTFVCFQQVQVDQLRPDTRPQCAGSVMMWVAVSRIQLIRRKEAVTGSIISKLLAGRGSQQKQGLPTK